MDINDFGLLGPSLEASWRLLGASWKFFWPSWGHPGRLGTLCGRLGGLLGRLGGFLAPSWPVLGPSWGRTSHATRRDKPQGNSGKDREIWKFRLWSP
eukprot:3021545-Pyramimonas_sp.AAC.1